MKGSAIFPHNNYATFRAICGDFRTAESEYKKAVAQDNADKRLKEWAYYRSILDIYKGMPKAGGEPPSNAGSEARALRIENGRLCQHRKRV